MAAARREEIGASAALGAHLVDVASRPAQGIHRVIADRVFGVLGPVAAPVRVVHDTVATASYGAVRVGARCSAQMVGLVAGALPFPRDGAAVTATAWGSVAVGAVNGLFGDRMHAEGSHLAVPFAVHERRREVAPGAAPLRRVQPAPTGHVVVFVHGLGETEQAWWYRHGGRGSHGEQLAALGATPVLLRYNTGRTVAENGADLAGVLATLHRTWPVPLHRIDLVGHSMGGLVLRQACGHQPTGTWLPLVRTACYLGTPHLGAPLAQGVHMLAGVLRHLPDTRPWAQLLDERSAGVGDLGQAHRLPLVDGVRHVAVAATLASDPGRWWAGAVGDGLVTVRSARHTGAETHVLPGTGHLALLTDPRVAQLLAELVAWEGPPAAGSVAVPSGERP